MASAFAARATAAPLHTDTPLATASARVDASFSQPTPAAAVATDTGATAALALELSAAVAAAADDSACTCVPSSRLIAAAAADICAAGSIRPTARSHRPMSLSGVSAAFGRSRRARRGDGLAAAAAAAAGRFVAAARLRASGRGGCAANTPSMWVAARPCGVIASSSSAARAARSAAAAAVRMLAASRRRWRSAASPASWEPSASARHATMPPRGTPSRAYPGLLTKPIMRCR